MTKALDGWTLPHPHGQSDLLFEKKKEFSLVEKLYDSLYSCTAAQSFFPSYD